MKKFALLSATIILGLNTLFAQDPWLNNVMGGFDNNSMNTQSNGLHVFNNQLYAATGSDSGYVYRTSTGQRNSWQKVFSQPNLTTVNAINSTASNFYVSGYFGYNTSTFTNPDSTIIYRSADGSTNWTPYFEFPGSAKFIIPFKGTGAVDSIYVVKSGANGSEIWKNDQLNTTNTWTQSNFINNEFLTITSNSIHNNKLYIGTNQSLISYKPTLWSSADGNTWTQENTTFLDTAQLSATSISSMVSYNNKFYIGTENSAGAEIWETTDFIVWNLVATYPTSGKITCLQVISTKLCVSLQGKYIGTGFTSPAAIVKDASVSPYNYSMNNGFGIQDLDGSNGSTIEFGNNMYYACNYSFMARIAGIGVPSGNQIWKLCLTTPPTVDLGPDITVCAGVTHTFDAGTGFSGYVWCDNSINQTLSDSYPQPYSIIVMGADGCESTDTVLLKNIPSPTNSGNFYDRTTILCKGDTVQLPVTAFSNLRIPGPTVQSSLTIPFYSFQSISDTLMVNIAPDEWAGNSIVSVTIDSLVDITNNGLLISLIPPFGLPITLSNYGYDSNYVGTTFIRGAGPLINGTAPYSGSFSPIDSLNNLSGSTNGIWILQITDTYGNNSGYLKGWSLNFSQQDTVVTYSWAPTSGLLMPSNASSLLASPQASTTYTLTVTNQIGCSSSDSALVEVPFLQINPHLPPICFGGSDSLSATIVGLSNFGQPNPMGYHWSSNAGLIDSLAFGLTVTPNNTTTYYVADTVSTGCPVHDTTVVNVSPFMTVDGGAPQTICLNDTATLVATVISGGTSPFTYLWNDGGTNYTGQTYLTSPASGTSYTLTVTDDWGCSSGSSTSVQINQLPVISTSASANTVCFGENIYITASGATTYSWDNGVTNGASFVPTVSTTYHVIGTDSIGCHDTSTIAVIVNSLPVIGANTTASIVCFNSNVTLTGSGALNYIWDNGVYDGIPFIPTASASYTVIGTDVNGCADTTLISLILNPPLSITSSSSPTVICYGDKDTLNGLASGGTAPFNYSWNDGVNTYTGATSLVTPTSSTSYIFTATDGAGCSIYDTTSVSITPSTDIYGHVDAAGITNITDGEVVIYKYLPYQTYFDTIQVVSIDVNGDYHFTSINHGSYLIKVFPTISTYPLAVPTYYGNQFLWTAATINNHDCNLNDTSDISVILSQGTPVGPGALGGLIREGLGFRQEGDPIPGLDVKLGKNPGGQIIASVQTDNNGYYYFGNLTLNNVGESYIVYADIPGLGRDSSYNVVLDPTHQLYDSLNYLVDSTTIYIVPTSSTGINNITSDVTSHFSIYPNPFKGNANIEYNISSEADVTLEIVNVLGVKIRSLVNSRQSAGNHKCNMNNQNTNLSSGVYFITLTIDGKPSTQRIVVME